MKRTGNLKNQVEKAETREAARDAIANAGMLLNDDELDQVGGGASFIYQKRRCASCKTELPSYWNGRFCKECAKDRPE